MLPLYQGVSAAKRNEGHAGLWFDKFCNTWTKQWSMSSSNAELNPKHDWLKQCVGSVGSNKQIEEQAMRVFRLGQSLGRASVFTTESRFVTGLGRTHPVENGFAFHPTLGVPFLPGSSVKGMVHAWVKAEGADEPTIRRLFGDRDRVGAVCFLDAIPTKCPKLEVDVMTPHYGGWTEKDAPGDWRSPVPIPFLVTKESTPFLFPIVARQAGDQAGADLDQAHQWLTDALTWAGAGAKTAVGYGRFRADPKATERFMEQMTKADESAAREAASATPEGKWAYEVAQLSEAQLYDQVLELFRDQSIGRLEQVAFARAVRARGVLEFWEQGKRKDGEKVKGKRREKQKERARMVRDVLRDEAGDD